MKNKSTLSISLIVASVLVALAVVASLTGLTYAVWTELASDSSETHLPIDEYNPSEKYIVWRALDENGDFADVTGLNASSYAVVGYSGLVAEVVIPSVHEGLAVTAICVSNIGGDYDYRLNGNGIITSITVPETVVKIADGACANMSNLSEVTLLGTGDITIGDLAFAVCPNLVVFNGGSRTIEGDEASYLLGSPAPF